MISRYIDVFAENLDESVIIKSMIDFKFETQTKPYMIRQVCIYLFLFVIPYFVLTFTELSPSYLSLCVYVSLIGVTLMFFYEFMNMVVLGL